MKLHKVSLWTVIGLGCLGGALAWVLMEVLW